MSINMSNRSLIVILLINLYIYTTFLITYSKAIYLALGIIVETILCFLLYHDTIA